LEGGVDKGHHVEVMILKTKFAEDHQGKTKKKNEAQLQKKRV